MKKAKDLSGQKFTRLEVLKRTDDWIRANGKPVVRYLCRCLCGKETKVLASDLRNGHTKSCGCWNNDRVGAINRSHGLAKTQLNCLWNSMKQRCNNPRDRAYKDYGGRGITICERWQQSFSAFLKDVGPRPPETTLERRDNGKGYSPDNCYWATRKQQGANKRNNVLLTFQGETHCIAEWSRIIGFRRQALEKRIRRGWSAERTLTIPLRQTKRPHRTTSHSHVSGMLRYASPDSSSASFTPG